MTTTSKSPLARTRYHHDAYQFLFEALRHAQRKLQRIPSDEVEEDETHITGFELVQGIRDLAVRHFGLLTNCVFRHWGVRTTEDFGRMVFELIERGEMRKTDQDQLSDFVDVYDFDEEFDRNYRIDTSHAFNR